jgi:hypothetical protein
MGKYLVGWLLGVPVFVLVILYFFFHYEPRPSRGALESYRCDAGRRCHVRA